MTVVVKISPNDRGTPASKLADAELHFTGGDLDGLKLTGFSIWERRGSHGRSVSFPGRQYRIGDERRSFALLRPIRDASAQEHVRDLILKAYGDYEKAAQGDSVYVAIENMECQCRPKERIRTHLSPTNRRRVWFTTTSTSC